MVAAGLGAVLVFYGVGSILEKCDLLTTVKPFWTVGLSAILFGVVLVIWTFADWPRLHLNLKWIGNDTVTMVVGVIAAMVAISALVHEQNQTDRCAESVKPVAGLPAAQQ